MPSRVPELLWIRILHVFSILPLFKLEFEVILYEVHGWGVSGRINIICLFSLLMANHKDQYVTDPHKLLDFEMAAKTQ